MSNKEASKSVRHSIGIACIRVIDHIPQILLINKRYTYAYSEFVHGRYPYDKNYVMELFNRMTNAEKILILSLNFELIWYHIWLNAPKITNYIQAKNRFETSYLQDGGSKLRYIIARSKSINTLWQIPKGRKRSKNETDLCCAVREFKEETGIEKIEIIPGFKEYIKYFFRKNYGLKGEARKKAPWVFKLVVFFAAKTDKKEIKLSDEHVGFVWLPYEEALKKLTYKNAKEIFKKANDFIDKKYEK